MTDCKNLDLARQWADGINAGVPVLAQAGHRAAAEVIRDLPDSWVDADKLREVVADHHIDMSEELMEALGALLPAPPAPRTMDEIEWDDEHQGLEAVYQAGTMWEAVVRMLCPMEHYGDDGIVCVEKSGRVFVPYPRDLTPLPGTKIDLTPTSTLEDEGEGGKRSPIYAATRAEIDRLNQRGGEYAPGGFLEGQTASPRPERVPEFDPAFTYRDKDGDTWEFLNHNWRCSDYRSEATNYLTPPDKYGPYTRIEA